MRAMKNRNVKNDNIGQQTVKKKKYMKPQIAAVKLFADQVLSSCNKMTDPCAGGPPALS